MQMTIYYMTSDRYITYTYITCLTIQKYNLTGNYWLVYLKKCTQVEKMTKVGVDWDNCSAWEIYIFTGPNHYIT